MEKQMYHHGDLKKELIRQGLVLLNREGLEGLSLRKVAKMCGVSHAAPYKHFKNKEELFSAIYNSAAHSLEEYLKQLDVQTQSLIDLGRLYVKFMIENPDYLKFLFFNEVGYSIKIEDNRLVYNEKSSFRIFHNSAEAYIHQMAPYSKDVTASILALWSLVHGIGVLLTFKSIQYDGNEQELVNRVLTGFEQSFVARLPVDTID